jgi:O-antigen ligase
MMALEASLGLAGLLCLGGFAAWFPSAATMLWICFLETSPELWFPPIPGGRELVIGAAKATGLILALILAIRAGGKRDRYNPGFAFAFIFGAGLVHGLFPGLSLLESLRSLIGSAVPFVFGFVNLPAQWRRAVIGAVVYGPTAAVIFDFFLWAAGGYPPYAFEQGTLRLGWPGQPPFLAGFALIAVYALLFEFLVRPSRKFLLLLLAVNFTILLLTGARAPLFLALAMMLAALFLAPQLTAYRRLMILAAAGALAALAALCLSSLSFIRVIGLTQLGEGLDLSNRTLVWPAFEQAIAASPWFGWGAGAGKVVIPVGSPLGTLIQTNAAHDEYLRIAAEGGAIGLALLIAFLLLWTIRGTRTLPQPEKIFLRLTLAAFAVHSATDNTLIATTSSIFFIWFSAVFASGPEEPKAAA